MAVPVHCSECDYRFKVPDEYAGKRGRCPRCKALLDVPGSWGNAGSVARAEPLQDSPRRAATPPPRRAAVATGASFEPDSGLPRITVRDSPDRAAHSGGAARLSPPHRRSGVPLWLWISLGSAAALLVSVMAWLLLSGDASDSSQLASAAPGRRLPSPVRAPAQPDTHPSGDDGKNRAKLVDTAGELPGSLPAPEAPGLGELPQAIVASTLEEVKQAVVKVEVPVAGGTKIESGSGFFVDGRGWIATNDHVIRNINSAARVRLAKGMICEVEGIIARVPDRDLALLKLRERPYQVTILDIRREATAQLGEQVYAFGHPYNADFSLSKGIVSRVLNTGELNDGARQMLQSTIQTPDNVVWIQHDAKISPGNSGGPLIDEEGRVLGVNSFVHLQAEFGYASDVRYLREMVLAAEDKATPLPPAANVAQKQDAGEVEQIKPDPARLRDLFAEAERFHFQPDSKEQYATLASLAAMLTAAKHVEQQPGNVPAEVAATAARTADELVAKLEAIDFRAEQFEAVNRFARNTEEKPGQGIFAFGTVVGKGPNAIILQVVESGNLQIDEDLKVQGGGGKNLIVQVGPELAKADPLSRWLVLGVYSNQIVQVQRVDGGEPQPMRVLLMYYMLKT